MNNKRLTPDQQERLEHLWMALYQDRGFDVAEEARKRFINAFGRDIIQQERDVEEGPEEDFDLTPNQYIPESILHGKITYPPSVEDYANLLRDILVGKAPSNCLENLYRELSDDQILEHARQLFDEGEL